ncbi:hypothetical protein H4R18_000962 [Coemansia javaensis]|uniref:B30.2/SPRY domain-containing protein n=1 Tax=Coemansia javaensis TaxID=2761396 RepID=A0A9W8HIC2_9FUNG|nr:hypothetical protein H4R18_000962 [Coemansia javaensis]
MEGRRPGSGPRSAWITIRGRRDDGQSASDDDDNASGSDAGAAPARARSSRTYHQTEGPASWQPLGYFRAGRGRGDEMDEDTGSADEFAVYPNDDTGGDDEGDNNEDEDGDEEDVGEDGDGERHNEEDDDDEEDEEDEEGDGEEEEESNDDDDAEDYADMRRYAVGLAYGGMQRGLEIAHRRGRAPNSDPSGSDSGQHDDATEGTGSDSGDEHGGRRQQFPAWRDGMASFEDLPSLVGPRPRRHTLATARRSRSKSRGAHTPFIPKYLEDTAYGAMFRRHFLDRRGQRPGGGDAGPRPSGGAGPDEPSPQVAPDMFFRTLVQDTWPHYCTPVPTMPPFVGLRMGYGLGISDSSLGRDSAAAGGSSNARPRRANSSGGGGNSGRAGPSAPSGGGGGRARAQRPQLPSGWATAKKSPNMEIGADRVTIRYRGPGRMDTDAEMVLSDVCIPARTGIYYYEVVVKSRGQSGYIGVGLARAGVSAARLPGWDAGSWGYHGDDGNGFSGDGRGSPYGPRYSTGDTVGCGFDFARRRVFFTRNGVFLGYAFDAIDADKDLYPCVGMRTLGEHVTANFGRRPFVFDIGHFAAAARADALKAIAATQLGALMPPPGSGSGSGPEPPSPSAGDAAQIAGLPSLRAGSLGAIPHRLSAGSSDAALSIVLMHLVHSEHYATAQALLENAIGQRSASSGPGPDLDPDLDPRLAAALQALRRQSEQRTARQRISQHICEGDIDHALGLLQDAYPRVLDDESLVFQLRCRQFIELVRAASGHHIADCVPSDGATLAPPRPPLHARAASQQGGMMDVDDTQSASVLSLAAITNAPTEPHRPRFGQIGCLRKMDVAQLVRVLLEYGRQLQADYGASPNPIIREGLVHTFSLLAYADPAQSPIAALLDPGACRPLARLVEMAIAAAEKAPRMSALERIYRQAAAALAELSARRSGAASLVSIERDFLRAASSGGIQRRDSAI